MKPHSKLVIAFHALLAAGASLAASAEPPTQVDACVEVYEVSQVQSKSIQKVFTKGSDADRVKLLQTLHRASPAVAKVNAVCQFSCPLGQRAVVESIREYRYGCKPRTENGVVIPTEFETLNLGCTMELEVSLGEREGSFSIQSAIHSTEIANLASHVDAKGEQQRGSEPPIFTTARIATQLQMVSGIPQWIGTYAPYKADQTTSLVGQADGRFFVGGVPATKPVQEDFASVIKKRDQAASDLTADVLRLVILTIRADK